MRQSGLLVHLTSLAGPEGIGTLGTPAREMIDFLHDAGVGVWQLLPVGQRCSMWMPPKVW